MPFRAALALALALPFAPPLARAGMAHPPPCGSQPPPLARLSAGQGRATASAAHAPPSEAVARLVADSLSAGATEVGVHLDLDAWGLHVHDNGCGVPADVLEALAAAWSGWSAGGPEAGARPAWALAAPPSEALPQRAALQSPAQHAVQAGATLASLALAAEEVEVVSRAGGSFETHAVLLRNGAIPRLVLAPEQRRRQGTSITMRGLFFLHPVRRKALLVEG